MGRIQGVGSKRRIALSRIKTMAEFHDTLNRVMKDGSFNINGMSKVLEVMELRLRRLESEAGIPMPDDIIRVREVEGRK